MAPHEAARRGVEKRAVFVVAKAQKTASKRRCTDAMELPTSLDEVPVLKENE